MNRGNVPEDEAHERKKSVALRQESLAARVKIER